MPADEVPPSRAFLTAAQSLQHLKTNARLGDAKHEATVARDAPTKVYQQTPQENHDNGRSAPERKAHRRQA